MAKEKGDEEEEEEVLHATGWDHVPLPKPEKSKYAITGHEGQVITIALGPGDSCKGEPGVMMYLTPGMTQQANCEGFCARCCSGESCCVINFTNTSNKEAYAALTPNFPTAKVVPVDLSSPNVNGSLITQQGAFMASHGEVEVGISLDCNLTRCCCGGMGLVRQNLRGNGTVRCSFCCD